MARILLVGNGPLPQCDPESLGFPQLRCAQFLRALCAEHEVALILLQSPDGGLPEDLHCCAITPGSAGWLELAQDFRDDFVPDIVVGGGPYDAARLSSFLAGDCPLWIDIPGDPFAEAQAKAVHAGGSGHTREMLGAYAEALRRADAFSVVSKAQRHALQGQLGLLGRLEQAPVQKEWLHVLPVGFEFGALEPQRPTAREKGKLVVALCGGYNTWTDGESLLKGLLLAMKRAPGLRVLSTGGAIEGHHSSTYTAFKSQALASDFSDRFTFHGWVAHSALPDVLREADVGLCLDRAGVEPELGSRTRVLFYLHQGLSVVATRRTELCRELVQEGLIYGISDQSPDELAEVLVGMCEGNTRADSVSDAQEFLFRRFLPAMVFEPLIDWVSAPARVPPGVDPSAEMALELSQLRAELAEVYASPTWRVSGIAERAIKSGSGRLAGVIRKLDPGQKPEN
jgi:glycosyltransferase involved in cell wall biosynthesis